MDYSRKFREVLLVCAPDVPAAEAKVLEESILNEEFPVVVEYPISVSRITIGDFPLFISAPNISPSSLKELSAKFKDPTVNLIVVNYPVNHVQCFSTEIVSTKTCD